MSYTTQY